MKKELILIAAVIISGALLFLSLVEFKNPISVPGNIEQNMFVIAVGIDKGTEAEGNYRLTVIGEKFSGESGGSSSSKGKVPDLVSVEGRTMFEVTRNFNLFKSKSLFWGHIKYILVSEEIAKEDILNVLDFFVRDQELRFNTTVAVVKDISAEKFLRVGEKIEKFIPDLLDGVFKNIPRLSISEQVSLLHVMQDFDSEYSDSAIPCIGLATLSKEEVKGGDTMGTAATEESNTKEESSTKEESGSKKNTGLLEESGSEEVKPNKEITGDQELSSKDVIYLDLDGFATFKEEKLLGYITHFTARGLNWVKSKVQSGIIVLKHETDDKDESHISMEIISADSKIKTTIKDDIPEATIDIKFSTNLGEMMFQEDIFDQEQIKKLNEQQNEIVKKEAEDVIEYSQKNGIDLLDISDKIYHQHPVEWEKLKEKWKETFKTMKITVNVESNINRTYHVREPIRSDSGEKK